MYVYILGYHSYPQSTQHPFISKNVCSIFITSIWGLWQCQLHVSLKDTDSSLATVISVCPNPNLIIYFFHLTCVSAGGPFDTPKTLVAKEHFCLLWLIWNVASAPSYLVFGILRFRINIGILLNHFDKYYMHNFEVRLLIRVCYLKRSYSPLSNFLSDLWNGAY